MSYSGQLNLPDYFAALEIPTSIKLNTFVGSVRTIFNAYEVHQHSGGVDGTVLYKFGDQLGNIFVRGENKKLGIGLGSLTVPGELLHIHQLTGENRSVVRFSNYNTSNKLSIGQESGSDNVIIWSEGSLIKFATDDSESMRIESDKVGIGITSPNTTLDIYAAGGVSPFNVDTNNGGEFNIDTWGTVQMSVNGNKFARLSYEGTTDGFLKLYDLNVEKVKIASVGNSYITDNLGIGNTSPGYKLSIQKTTVGDSQLLELYNPDINAGSEASIIFSEHTGGSKTSTAGISSLNITGANEGALLFKTNQGVQNTLVEVMRLDNNGRVGIGNPNPPCRMAIDAAGGTSALYLSHDITQGVSANRGGTIGFAPGELGGTGALIATNYFGSASESRLTIRAYDNAHQLVLHESGNVGIGLTNPSVELEVDGDIKNKELHLRENTIEEWSTNGNASVAFNYNGYNGGTTQYRNVHIYDGKQNSIALFDGATRRLGIGTTNPGALLDVYEGDIRITDNNDADRTINRPFDPGANNPTGDSYLEIGQRNPNGNGSSIRFVAGGTANASGNYSSSISFNTIEVGTTNFGEVIKIVPNGDMYFQYDRKIVLRDTGGDVQHPKIVLAATDYTHRWSMDLKYIGGGTSKLIFRGYYVGNYYNRVTFHETGKVDIGANYSVDNGYVRAGDDLSPGSSPYADHLPLRRKTFTYTINSGTGSKFAHGLTSSKIRGLTWIGEDIGSGNLYWSSDAAGGTSGFYANFIITSTEILVFNYGGFVNGDKIHIIIDYIA